MHCSGALAPPVAPPDGVDVVCGVAATGVAAAAVGAALRALSWLLVAVTLCGCAVLEDAPLDEIVPLPWVEEEVLPPLLPAL